jgi:hypothetical protein
MARRLTDVTERAGVGAMASSVAAADYDNDGDVDLTSSTTGQHPTE